MDAMRIVAVLEVVFACCLCHLTYRALQQTALGQFEQAVDRSYLPGSVMLVFTLLALLVHRRRTEVFGVTWKHWPYSVFVGLVSTLLFTIVGGPILLLGLPPTHWLGALARILGGLLGSVLLLFLLNRRSFADPERFGGGWAAWLGPCLLVSLLALPLLLGLRSHQPYSRTVAGVVWLFVLTGFGEELFFRGYVQSRLNFAFGRPCRLQGMSFGAGLLIASVLFGGIHVLNTVDYFQGRYEFGWTSGCISVFNGLYYGCLRERTGSVLAGGIAHGLAGAMTEIPRVWSASP
jgi:membrane protease YdiL (CAAX protease family)